MQLLVLRLHLRHSLSISQSRNSCLGIVIKLFDDHLVIWNAGLLPPTLTAMDLFRLHKAFPHNKLIAQAFYNTGIIEEWGSGTTEYAKELKEANLPTPEFDLSSPKVFKLTLPRSTAKTKHYLGLTGRQRKALEHLRQDVSITNADYQSLTKASKTSAQRDLKDLLKRGLIEKRGVGKAIKYSLAHI